MFLEFAWNAWEKRKFKNLVVRVNKTSDNSTIPSVEFEDIISKQGRLNKDVRLKVNSKQGIYFEPQDVLFGKLRPYLQNWLFPSFYGRAVGDFWVLRANSSLLSEYLFVLIQSPRFQSVANISSGIKMPRSDWNTVSNTSFSIPVQSEQRRIEQLFNVLDDLIAATQHKIDALEQAKKVLLQRLFDQSWRFKDYSDPWEKRKLGELVEIQNGYAFESKYFTEAPTKFVVVTPGSVLIGGGFRFGSGHFYDLNGPVPRDFVFKPGDLFLTLTDLTPSARLLGYSAFVPHDDNVYLHNQRLGKIESIGSSLSFIYYLTSTPSFHNAIVRGASGTTVKHSSKAKVLSYQSEIPFLSEQHQISSFLKKFDDLIAATQSRLSSLELLKKFLLQNLFI